MRRTAWSRFIALCTMIFMAHSSLVGTDLVCASHAGAHSKMSHTMPSASAAQSANDDAPCEVPSTDHCCDAMSGCAVTLATTGTLQTQHMPVSGEAVVSCRIAAPASLVTAPETPPPKA
jgi:hypothetical protein